MPKLRESNTAVLVRGERVADGYATEPYEAGWAQEAIVFALGMDEASGGTLSVQISPDGFHWVDDGATVDLPAAGGVAFTKLSHFGNWLRFAASVPGGGERRLMVTVHFKG